MIVNCIYSTEVFRELQQVRSGLSTSLWSPQGFLELERKWACVNLGMKETWALLGGTIVYLRCFGDFHRSQAQIAPQQVCREQRSIDCVSKQQTQIKLVKILPATKHMTKTWRKHDMQNGKGWQSMTCKLTKNMTNHLNTMSTQMTTQVQNDKPEWKKVTTKWQKRWQHKYFGFPMFAGPIFFYN